MRRSRSRSRSRGRRRSRRRSRSMSSSRSRRCPRRCSLTPPWRSTRWSASGCAAPATPSSWPPSRRPSSAVSSSASSTRRGGWSSPSTWASSSGGWGARWCLPASAAPWPRASPATTSPGCLSGGRRLTTLPVWATWWWRGGGSAGRSGWLGTAGRRTTSCPALRCVDLLYILCNTTPLSLIAYSRYREELHFNLFYFMSRN